MSNCESKFSDSLRLKVKHFIRLPKSLFTRIKLLSSYYIALYSENTEKFPYIDHIFYAIMECSDYCYQECPKMFHESIKNAYLGYAFIYFVKYVIKF